MGQDNHWNPIIQKKDDLANRRVEIYIQGLLTKEEVEKLKQRVDVLANQ